MQFSKMTCPAGQFQLLVSAQSFLTEYKGCDSQNYLCVTFQLGSWTGTKVHFAAAVAATENCLPAASGCQDQPTNEHYPLQLHPWAALNCLPGEVAVTRGSAMS